MCVRQATRARVILRPMWPADACRVDVIRFARMWLVSVYALCYLASIPLEREPDACLLSCEELCNLRLTLLASDGNVYGALALQRWVRTCIGARRSVQVIPGKPITWVQPVQILHVPTPLCESAPDGADAVDGGGDGASDDRILARHTPEKVEGEKKLFQRPRHVTRMPDENSALARACLKYTLVPHENSAFDRVISRPRVTHRWAEGTQR